MADIDDLNNKTKYLIDPPSDEAISLRKEHDDPFVVTIKRKDIARMQRFFNLNKFYDRLEEAGIVSLLQYDPRIHNGYRKGFYDDEQPVVGLMLFHKDRQILHDLMEEFVTRDLVKSYGWKKLKHLYVN